MRIGRSTQIGSRNRLAPVVPAVCFTTIVTVSRSMRKAQRNFSRLRINSETIGQLDLFLDKCGGAVPTVYSAHVELSTIDQTTQTEISLLACWRRLRPHLVVVATMVTAAVAITPRAEAAAQESGTENEDRSTITAIQLGQEETVHLDGRVDEQFWRRGTPASGFLQENPNEGEPATEVTEVYVAYDADNLYIGAILYDSDPSGILGNQMERDGMIFADDRFMWILDTFLDGRTGYYFEINPAGLMGDGLLGGGGGGRGGGGGGGGGFGGGGGRGFGVNKSWDGIWEARVERNGEGWSAEIRIPFRTLNFNPEQDTWGINFHRTVRRKQEESRWTGHRRNQQFTRPVHAGRLTGLQGMSQGLGLEAVPYGLFGWTHTPENDDPTEFPADAGIDVSYNVTPSLRAAVTVNTDFAEVESDERRVNLTRFPMYFPEKRDFFLEGSGVFSFSPTSGIYPYFSRNIGLYEGEPVPITYGARLGGQMGMYELGLVHVHTASDLLIDEEENDTTDIQPEDFTIARIKRSMFEQSTLGFIYTRRHTAVDDTGYAPPDRHTFGADLDLFTSTFMGDKNLQAEAFFLGHTDPESEGTSSFADLTARGIRINYPNDILQIHTSYRELGDDFDPAVGFTRRNGLKRIQPTIGFAPRPADFLGIRQLRWRLQFEYLMNTEWERETQKTDFTLLNVNMHSGDDFSFTVTHLRERLDEEFEIHDGVTIPIGDYETIEWQAFLRTASKRIVSTRARASGGEFWSGTKKEYSVDLTFRPMPGISMESEYEWNSVSLREGEFTTNVVRADAKWQMSPWMSLTNNVQYDDVSDIVGLFSKFRWIITPGSELFVVYTHNWQNMDGGLFDRFRLETLSRGATTKINYTYRF